MEELIKRINEEAAAFNVDATAFSLKGNKAAAVRARKAALAIMNDLKEFRKQSIILKNA